MCFIISLKLHFAHYPTYPIFIITLTLRGGFTGNKLSVLCQILPFGLIFCSVLLLNWDVLACKVHFYPLRHIQCFSICHYKYLSGPFFLLWHSAPIYKEFPSVQPPFQSYKWAETVSHWWLSFSSSRFLFLSNNVKRPPATNYGNIISQKMHLSQRVL